MSIVTSITIVLLLMSAGLVVGIIYCIVQALEYRPRFSLDMERPRKRAFTLRDDLLKKRWEGILARTNFDSVESMKLSIIEADKMVDDVLKRLGLSGQHMADRLEQMNDEDYQTLTGLWRAHRLRNNIVHTPGFEVSPAQVTRALEEYRAFLGELQVIE